MRVSTIYPITQLKTHTKELVGEVADGGEAVVITQNGRPAAVLVNVQEHDRLQDTLAMLKLLAHSQLSLSRTGRMSGSEEVRRRARNALIKAAGHERRRT